MLTLTHYVHSVLGPYWYSLSGSVVDSEGSDTVVGEACSSLESILDDIEYYKNNGFIGGSVLTHKVIYEA